MAKHLKNEIDKLKAEIGALGVLVSERIDAAIAAVWTRDAVAAQAVVEGDNDVDDLEVRIEEECLKVLALYQPVANDLRVIVAILKVNNDLERIGDLAVNIAQRAERLSELGKGETPMALRSMGEKTQHILRMSLDSLNSFDSLAARKVCGSDNEVDTMNRENYGGVLSSIAKEPARAEEFIVYLSVSKHLERVSDHACNIAEDVLYTVEGEIVRHSRGGIN